MVSSFLLLCALPLAHALCSIDKTADIIIYDDQAGGVGPDSSSWTASFFTWLKSANPGLVVSYVKNAEELSNYYTDGCKLSDEAEFPRLKLYVQPGGDAYNASIALGPGGRDNILDFAADTTRHAFMGTCAGWYWATGTYWWYGAFFPSSWMAHWWPTVEGPVSAIAAYPSYAPALLTNGMTQIYFGGPVNGLNLTSGSLPNGTTVLATYDEVPGLPAGIPAVLNYTGLYVRALFNSPHPEAVAGVGISCEAPLPSGCISPAQQLQNWQFLAQNINNLVREDYAIPATLQMPQ